VQSVQHSMEMLVIKDSIVTRRDQEEKSLQPTIQPPARFVEPSSMQEFRENSSLYLVDDKVDSEEISSEGEFERADEMEVMAEDDPNVLRI